jgi:hypothetical protein
MTAATMLPLPPPMALPPTPPTAHRQAADRGLGAFDFHRTQGFDGAHAHGLHATRFVTGVGVTGQARLAAGQQHRHRGKGSNQQNRLTHSINSKGQVFINAAA